MPEDHRPNGHVDVPGFFEGIRTGILDEVVRKLDAHPWLVDVVNPGRGINERQPLHCAAGHGRLDIVKELVVRDAEIHPYTPYHYPPVIVAHWEKQEEVRRYFLEEIPGRAAGTNGLGVGIVMAARCGWVEIVKEHTKRDALAVFQRGPIFETALHWAAHNDAIEVVRVLLAAGADVEADETGLYGGKPLHWAAEHQPESVRVLLGHGADVNSRNMQPGDYFGRTPLIMNASQDDDCHEVTKLLIEAGADIHATDGAGNTALDHAEAGGRTRIADVLRRSGA